MDLDLTLTEILAATVLALIVLAFVLTPYSFENEKSKKSMLNFYFFTILVIAIGAMHYKNTKEDLVDGFYKNQELLCKEENEQNLILSQAKGFALKSGYFISDGHIVYIGKCILLEDTTKNKEVRE